jgi:hypothetical protein
MVLMYISNFRCQVNEFINTAHGNRLNEKLVQPA